MEADGAGTQGMLDRRREGEKSNEGCAGGQSQKRGDDMNAEAAVNDVQETLMTVTTLESCAGSQTRQ